MNIGEKIKLIREKNGLTQKQLSELTGINRGTIGNYERGARTPNIEILKKLADALKVNINELLDLDYSNPINYEILEEGLKVQLNTISNSKDLMKAEQNKTKEDDVFKAISDIDFYLLPRDSNSINKEISLNIFNDLDFKECFSYLKKKYILKNKIKKEKELNDKL